MVLTWVQVSTFFTDNAQNSKVGIDLTQDTVGWLETSQRINNLNDFFDTDETVWDEIHSVSMKVRHNVDAQGTLVTQSPPVFPGTYVARYKVVARAIKF